MKQHQLSHTANTIQSRVLHLRDAPLPDTWSCPVLHRDRRRRRQTMTTTITTMTTTTAAVNTDTSASIGPSCCRSCCSVWTCSSDAW